jgi:hypothetical protein
MKSTWNHVVAVVASALSELFSLPPSDKLLSAVPTVADAAGEDCVGLTLMNSERYKAAVIAPPDLQKNETKIQSFIMSNLLLLNKFLMRKGGYLFYM